MEFFTIGVYNSEAEDFFGKLTDNNIDTFADIRQRRGVRGARYAFVNCNRLQYKLLEMRIRYDHTVGLAPTREIRGLQNKTDKQQKQKKIERTRLSDDFIAAYEHEIISTFNFDEYLKKLDEQEAQKIAFFCVEEFPEACHRSLVAKKLNELGFKITHL